MTLPEDHTGWKEHISQAMAENDGLAWYALVDPCSDKRLPAKLWELQDNPDIVPLFMNTVILESSMSGPLFVPLQASSPLTEWLLSESAHVPIGIFYGVEKSAASALFEHLQNLLECRLPGGAAGIFRFYDPRVLYAVVKGENDGWSNYVVGQAAVVHAWEPGCRQPLILAAPGWVLEEEGREIDQELLDDISIHTSPYAVIASMRGERGEALRAMPLPEAYAYVRGVCDSIASMGIPYLQDFVVGTSLAMQLGSNIFADEYIRGIVMAREEKETLLDVMRRVPDAYLERFPEIGKA